MWLSHGWQGAGAACWPGVLYHPTWPPLVRGRVDTLRLEWLSDERFTSVDVMVAEDTSVLVAVRKT